ncbi:unnamed protein product [Closterium sp. NIES-54]
MPTRGQGPVGLAQQHTPGFAPFPPLEVNSTASFEASQNPVVGLTQKRTSFAPFQPPPSLRHPNAAGTVPRTGSHSPRRLLEALPPSTASCGSSPARIPAACFRGAQNPCGGSSSAFSPQSAALEAGQGIFMGPPGVLPVASSRLSFAGAPQPYYIPALLQSARSSAAEMFHFPRSPSTESDDLYPDSPHYSTLSNSAESKDLYPVDIPRLLAAPGLPPHTVGPPHKSHHRRSRSSMSDEQTNMNPAGYHLRAEPQQPSEYTHCLTWQGGPRRYSNEGTGPVPRVTSHDVAVVTTNGGNVTVASVSANPGGFASEKRGSGRLCRSVQDDDVAEGAAPCQRGKPSAEGVGKERAACSRSRENRGSGRMDGRTNGRSESGDSEEKLAGSGGVGRSVAGSGKRSSGRLCRNLGGDEDEDQRSGKGGSGRLWRNLENDDVAAADGTPPRQRVPAGLSAARRNPPPRHAKGGSEGDGRQPDGTTRSTQPNPTRTQPNSQGQPSGEARERSSSPRVGPAGSNATRSGSGPRTAGAAAGRGEGASTRQSSRPSRGMERDGGVGRAGSDASSSRQNSRLGGCVEKEGGAAQQGSVVGKKLPSRGVRFGDGHGDGVASERGVVGRRGVRGGERGGEHNQGGSGHGRRQPVKLGRSLDDDDKKDGEIAGENNASPSGRRLERSIEEEDDEDNCKIAALGASQKPRKSLERHLSDDDDDDDENERALGGKSRGGSRRYESAGKEVEAHDSVGAEKNMHKSRGLLHKIFQRD